VKLRALVALIALALAGASLAYAAPKAVNTKPTPPPGNSTHTNTNGKKPQPTGTNCRPRVSLILKGTLSSTGSDTGTYLMVNVTGGSHLAKKAYKGGDPVKVYVDASTKFRGSGHYSLTSLPPTNARLVVQTRAVCKAYYLTDPQTNPEPLTAKRVTAHPAKS
jgi:hypothetical protein